MSSLPRVSALHVANEAFLVASTIERCPKTMMLRELVMNALEAASTAPRGTGAVVIGTCSVDGHDKLYIWNNGLGMTADDLKLISNLSSSLHKQNALDGNFGMGVKVAALPANKRGLLFRSCHDGVVSEVLLGQRDGVYGRVLQGDPPAEVRDVTHVWRWERNRDRSADWTDVLLLGNRDDQNTVSDPYDADPAVQADWIEKTLTRRFYRLPAGVRLLMSARASGSDTERAFTPLADRSGDYVRYESVATPEGIVIHYGYDPPLATATQAQEKNRSSNGGIGGIVHRDEIYALREGRAWIVEAPSLGMPFGAGTCAVFVELPERFRVRPEAYRQFLCFCDGDQRQVTLADFTTLVRTHMPQWLRDVIAAHGPEPADYAEALRTELADLLVHLAVPARSRAAGVRGAATPAMSPAAKIAHPDVPPPPAKPTLRFEPPPEIISLHEEALVNERGLHGRVAKYYPDSHQLFLNLTYAAIGRMAADLCQYFDAATDPERAEQQAAAVAEWAIARKVARAVVYTLAKRDAGWTAEEVARAQSPESLSIVADDYKMLLRGARRRLAQTLGIELAAADDDAIASSHAAYTTRLAGELADARQAAQRALSDPTRNAAPLLRRVSDIEARRRNLPAALAWARKALAAAPDDPWSHNHVAIVLQQLGDLDGAERAAQCALQRSGNNPVRFLRQLSAIARQRGDMAGAIGLARQAIAASPRDAQVHCELAWLLQQDGNLDAADDIARGALAAGVADAARLLRQRSLFAQCRGNVAMALEFAHQAVAADNADPQSHGHLAWLLHKQGELAAAASAARQATTLEPAQPARYLRQHSVIEQQRGNLQAALELARQAIECDPFDAWTQSHLATLLGQEGNHDDAASAVRRALALEPANAALFLRQLSHIEIQRKNLPVALELARQAVVAGPRNPWVLEHLAAVLLQVGDLEGAALAARQAIDAATDNTGRFLRQLSAVERKRGDIAAASLAAAQAVEADQGDAASHAHLISVLLELGQLEAAEQAARRALDLRVGQTAHFLRPLSEIAARRKNMAAAIAFAEQAAEAEPENVWTHHYLSGLLLQMGDLSRAQTVADRALALSDGELEPIRRRLEDIAVRRQRLAA